MSISTHTTHQRANDQHKAYCIHYEYRLDAWHGTWNKRVVRCQTDGCQPHPQHTTMTHLLLPYYYYIGTRKIIDCLGQLYVWRPFIDQLALHHDKYPSKQLGWVTLFSFSTLFRWTLPHPILSYFACANGHFVLVPNCGASQTGVCHYVMPRRLHAVLNRTYIYTYM